MLMLPPLPSTTQNPPQSFDLSRFRTCETLQETRQLHSLSVKTGTWRHTKVSSKLVHSYAATGVRGLSYARLLFDEMPDPNLFCYNLLIKYYIEYQLSNDAIMLFRELVGEHVPDGFTLPCVIKGCARLAAVDEGKQVHGLVLKIGYGGDKFVESSLVNMYAKCGCVDLARKVFDRMEERDLVCWNSLIDGYARCGEFEVARQLFDEMPERDCVSWTVLMDGFSKCGKVKAAREIFNKMPDKTTVTWNAMIDGYMKAGEVLLAERLFDEMERRDVVTWNSMITGYDLNGRFDEAIRAFRIMLGEGFTPNQATLVGALSTTSGLASLGNGRWVHSYIVKNGYDLDGVLGTSLIEMYSKCGSIESALDAFRSISRKKLGHWTAIVVGLGMHGMAGHALQLFVEMREAGIIPTAITFIGVLNACNHAGLVDHGRRYFDMMEREYRIEPTIEHYGCFVDILCRAGRLKEAKYVINTIPVKPNQVIWMSLLSGSRNQGNLKMAEYAAKHIIETAPETIGCYIVLSNMYAAAGLWTKVAEVREMMKKNGIKKDPGCSSIEHKGMLHQFTVGDKSHPQTGQIFLKLTEMGEKLKSAGHVPDTSQVLLCVDAEEDKEAELQNHSERLAIAFGLINVDAGSPIRIMKNLRVCSDCHSATKLLSSIYDQEIIVRDNSRFHHFRNGSCSCNDFW